MLLYVLLMYAMLFPLHGMALYKPHNNIRQILFITMGNTVLDQLAQNLPARENSHSLSSPYAPRSNLTQPYSIDLNVLRAHGQLYLLRQLHPSYFPIIHDILGLDKIHICTHGQCLTMHIQSLPYRLSDLGVISFQSALYILHTVLQGYHILHKAGVGFFFLEQGNICFNSKGQCKFWIIQQIQQPLPHVSMATDQEKWINQLLQVVMMRVEDTDQQFTKDSQGHNITVEKMMKIVNKYRNTEYTRVQELYLSQIETEATDAKQRGQKVKISLKKQTKKEQKKIHRIHAENKYNSSKPQIKQQGGRKVSLSLHKTNNHTWKSTVRTRDQESKRLPSNEYSNSRITLFSSMGETF